MQPKPNSKHLEAQKKLHQVYKNCFTTEAGKAVLDDLKKLCNYNTSMWSGNKDDLLVKEGERRVLLRLINWSDPKFFEKFEQVGESK